jgi:hypothetical protein
MFPDDPYNFETHRTIRKLASSSGCIPRTLFLDNVQCHESDPVGGGGFADVWRGLWNDNFVALKRLRIFGPRTGQKDKLIKARYHLCTLAEDSTLTICSLRISLLKRYSGVN